MMILILMKPQKENKKEPKIFIYWEVWVENQMEIYDSKTKLIFLYDPPKLIGVLDSIVFEETATET